MIAAADYKSTSFNKAINKSQHLNFCLLIFIV